MTGTADPAAAHDLVLLAAGSGPEVRGWLFAVDHPSAKTPSATIIDGLNTSGIVSASDRIYRVLSSPSEPNASGEPLVYDNTGVVAYHRIDGLADPHGVIWAGQHLVVPCSFTNEIFWLTAAGTIARTWRAPGDGDAWHVNGVHFRGGRLCASAFGVFTAHRGWAKTMGEPTGIIFDVESQGPIVRGLSCPHDPIFVDGGWLVCDSFTRRLLFVDEGSGAPKQAVNLDGWTRGVAVAGDRIFVGLSGARHGSENREKARIVVLSRQDWRVLAELSCPAMRSAPLALIPRAALAGIKRGFRTNDLRVAVQDRRDLFELAGLTTERMPVTPMEAIERPRDFRTRIMVSMPRSVRAGGMFDVRLKIKNRGRHTFITAPPFPINIAVVFEAAGAPPEAADVRRLPLPEPIVSGATIRFIASLASPSVAGKYRVRFTLLQEWVRWFDNDQRWLAQLASTNRRHRRLNVV